MSEKRQRRSVIDRLKSLDAMAVENGVQLGTPDVNFIEGWIELKYVPKAPARLSTPVRIDHFTAEQRAWLRRRWHRGGLSCLYLQIGRLHMLFDGCTGANVVGMLPIRELRDYAHFQHVGWPPAEDLIEALQSLQPPRSRPCGCRGREHARS